MKRLNKLMIPLSVLAMTGCSTEDLNKDLNSGTDKGTAIFTITTPTVPGVDVISRADDKYSIVQTITEMRWLVSDPQGNILDHHYGCLNESLSQLTLEGLKYGDYNLLFAATLTEGTNITFNTPTNFNDPWLINNCAESPVEGMYCYKKVPFHVGSEGTAINVVLEHSVARVYVDLTMPNPSLWRHIKHVRVTFNDEIPTSLNAGGTYSGTHKVKAYDIYDPSGVFTFTTFPSDKPISGYVEIESSRDGGEDFVQRYDFSDLKLEGGKISHIDLEYRHPEKDDGLLYVAANELWRYEPSTMFLSSEERSVFYNANLRSFYAEKPLQIWITAEGKLGVKFYSPIPIKNVKVTGCFNKLTAENVEIALLEEVTPFMEAYFTLPVQNHDCTYQTLSGRKINIPVQPNIKP